MLTAWFLYHENTQSVQSRIWTPDLCWCTCVLATKPLQLPYCTTKIGKDDYNQSSTMNGCQYLSSVGFLWFLLQHHWRCLHHTTCLPDDKTRRNAPGFSCNPFTHGYIVWNFQTPTRWIVSSILCLKLLSWISINHAWRKQHPYST